MRTRNNAAAKWDDPSHMIFVQICEDEVKKGNRVNTTFSEVGWLNVQTRFRDHTGKDYTIKQLRSHWGIMKTDWQLFIKLKRGYTSLEWDEFTKTIDVSDSDSWWDERIKENPKFKKLKKFKGNKLLLNWFSYVTIFGDIFVTGERARDQHSSVGYDSTCDEILYSTPNKESGEEACDDNREDLSTQSLCSTSHARKSKSRGRTKRKKVGVEYVCGGALACESTSSVAEALDILDSMSEPAPMSSLYHFAQQFLTKKDHRTLWFRSQNNELRLGMLKFNYNYEHHLIIGGSW